MWMKNNPVVHEYGQWIDHLRPQALQDIAIYASSRLSQFYDYSKAADLEQCKALQRAAHSAFVSSLLSSLTVVVGRDTQVCFETCRSF